MDKPPVDGATSMEVAKVTAMQTSILELLLFSNTIVMIILMNVIMNYTGSPAVPTENSRETSYSL